MLGGKWAISWSPRSWVFWYWCDFCLPHPEHLFSLAYALVTCRAYWWIPKTVSKEGIPGVDAYFQKWWRIVSHEGEGVREKSRHIMAARKQTKGRENSQAGWTPQTQSRYKAYMHTPGPTSYFSLPPNNAILWIHRGINLLSKSEPSWFNTLWKCPSRHPEMSFQSNQVDSEGEQALVPSKANPISPHEFSTQSRTKDT